MQHTFPPTSTTTTTSMYSTPAATVLHTFQTVAPTYARSGQSVAAVHLAAADLQHALLATITMATSTLAALVNGLKLKRNM
jgi:hypothetical protein